MRIVRPSEDAERVEFAAKAKAAFKKHPTYNTFAKDDPEPGGLLAIRWNDFTVMVLKIDEGSDVLLYDTEDLPEVEYEEECF